ncbi:sensor histidine kinase [Paramaledivibacter caminithermalis]|uniref:Sensor_kinase_SpoOB-type, alpha-helical domain n=1 Tax=Paramaledivibacter caminithermalis (strain DSM 15212 / CIP 107654 / DViRD3) TaxID=1121301 RepID=A0A1M6NN52_PARC5|nr:GHKL domain-containing protein [Paramaledivibacter caminithermalis]SHJ97088.1 Sensor_kinase_SpoOB-type, alpha-helical domain [Paramaledivibacter caminithermalis DSM 15212]
MKNRNKYIIILTMLFQSMVIIILDYFILNSVTLNMIRENIFLNYVLMIVIAVTTVLMFISLKKFSYYEKKEAEFKLIKANMESTEELINLLKSQRDDYLTHIQSINALVYLEEYKELSKYLKGISENYRFNCEIIKVGHPALTALINVKREIARKKGIFFYVKCKEQIKDMEIPSWDLCSLFSNLFENAIEAALMAEGKKWIKLIINYYEDNYVFQIENTGQIEETIMNNLFKQGNTSKSSPGRGYGLYISKKIVDKYEGNIDIKNTNLGTVVATIKLPGKVENYDKKIS